MTDALTSSATAVEQPAPVPAPSPHAAAQVRELFAGASAFARLGVLYGLAWLVVLVGFAVAGLRWTAVTITSDSMTPGLHRGDVVLAAPSGPASVRTGSVIVFDDPAGAGHLVTHRVIGIDADGRYRTKGDASIDADSTPVPHEAVRGVGRIAVPYLGLPVLWLSGAGRVLGWLVAATVCAVAIARYRPRSGHRSGSVVAGLLAVVAVVPALTISPAHASFDDLAANGGNAVSAATLAAPSGLSGIASPGHVALDWTASASSFSAGYKIYRSATSGSGFSLIATVAGRNTTTYDDPSTPTATVYYQVRAYYLGWLSVPSAEAAVAPASVPWTPANLSNLAVWLDANDASTFTLSGSSVSQWNDKSGHGRNVTQATAADQPARVASTIGGKPAVVFDGSDDVLYFADGSFLANTAFSVAAVATRTSNKADNNIIGGTDGGGKNLHMGWDKDVKLRFSAEGSATDIDIAVPGYTAPITRIQLGLFGLTTKSYYLDGSLGGTKASTDLLVSWANASLGRYKSVYFSGQIGEIVMTTSELSQSDREKLEGYLAHKWGTASSLPAAHPYKAAAPTV